MPVPQLLIKRPAKWPQFSSDLRSVAVTARVGRVLGIAFAVCFVTGLLSHYQYTPWRWLPIPAAPSWGYRLSQGTHVITGIACIPLLLVKLWSVYHRLFEWPALRSVGHALERASVAVLVSSSILQLVTGFLNVLQFYAWPWPFVAVLNGERLSLDHGYPVRLIAPDRAGVLQTKWLARIEIRDV